MTLALATPRSVSPARAAPANGPLSALGMIYTLWRNPLEIWSRAISTSRS